MSIFDKLTSPEAKAFAAQVEQPFLQLPHLPAGIVNFLVSIAPYMAVLFGILTIVTVPFSALAMGLSLLTLNPVAALGLLVGAVINLASAVIMLMAYKPLKAKQMTGWYYMFWVQILSVAASILMAIDSGAAGIVGSIIGILIGLYVTYEMKRGYSEV